MHLLLHEILNPRDRYYTFTDNKEEVGSGIMVVLKDNLFMVSDSVKIITPVFLRFFFRPHAFGNYWSFLYHTQSIYFVQFTSTYVAQGFHHPYSKYNTVWGII